MPDYADLCNLGEYVVRFDDGTNWYSVDGKRWRNQAGTAVVDPIRLATSEPLSTTVVEFHGGRLDGQSVRV
jgi:hypothetical protein